VCRGRGGGSKKFAEAGPTPWELGRGCPLTNTLLRTCHTTKFGLSRSHTVWGRYGPKIWGRWDPAPWMGAWLPPGNTFLPLVLFPPPLVLSYQISSILGQTVFAHVGRPKNLRWGVADHLETRFSTTCSVMPNLAIQGQTVRA